MNKLSIRTLMLTTLGFAMLISIFTRGAFSANVFHFVLVMAFAIPGASWRYDQSRSSRGLVIRCCASATVGTVLLSVFVLIGGFR